MADGGNRGPKKFGGTAPRTGSVVVSVDSPQPGRRRWILLSVLVLLLLAGGGAAWWWQGRPEEKPPVTYEQAAATARDKSDLWQYDQAIDALEAYLADVPEDKRNGKEYNEALLSLAKAYYDNKQYDQAIDRYEQLLGNDEYRLDAQRGLGKAYAAKGNKARARDYLQAVVDTMKTRTDPESQFRITMDEAELNAVQE